MWTVHVDGRTIFPIYLLVTCDHIKDIITLTAILARVGILRKKREPGVGKLGWHGI